MLTFQGRFNEWEVAESAKDYIKWYLKAGDQVCYVPYMDGNEGKKKFIKFALLNDQWVYIDNSQYWFMSTDVLLIIAVGLFINAVILYLIIKWAVRPPMEEQINLLKKQNRMLVRQLEKDGLNSAEIASVLVNDKYWHLFQ